MSTAVRRLAVLATLVALVAPTVLTVAAIPAAADDIATVTIETSPSGDVPVGQAMTVTVAWQINVGVVGSFPLTVAVAIPAGFRVDDAPQSCVVSPNGFATSIRLRLSRVLEHVLGEIDFAVTAVRESYDATFDAAVYYPEVFEANDSLTIDSYVPGVTADVHPLAFDAPNPLVVGQSFTLVGNAANAGTTTMQGVKATIDLAAPLPVERRERGAHPETPCTISGLRATCAIGTLFGSLLGSGGSLGHPHGAGREHDRHRERHVDHA